MNCGVAWLSCIPAAHGMSCIGPRNLRRKYSMMTGWILRARRPIRGNKHAPVKTWAHLVPVSPEHGEDRRLFRCNGICRRSTAGAGVRPVAPGAGMRSRFAALPPAIIVPVRTAVADTSPLLQMIFTTVRPLAMLSRITMRVLHCAGSAVHSCISFHRTPPFIKAKRLTG